MTVRSLCVYCGSRTGRNPAYENAASELGRELATQGIRLVYGGGHVGLMGLVADAVMQYGGEVIGVIPEALAAREAAHRGVSELIVTRDMHERKAIMADHADAFLALPGGIGTLEELFEAWTWTQLGFHDKPCVLLNTEDYYRHLLRFLDQMVDEGFLAAPTRSLLRVAETPKAAISLAGPSGG